MIFHFFFYNFMDANFWFFFIIKLLCIKFFWWNFEIYKFKLWCMNLKLKVALGFSYYIFDKSCFHKNLILDYYFFNKLIISFFVYREPETLFVWIGKLDFYSLNLISLILKLVGISFDCIVFCDLYLYVVETLIFGNF